MTSYSNRKGSNITKPTFPLPCIVCGEQLEGVSEDTNQPYNGLNFTGYGAYGSDFDPMDSNYSLLITICDDCLALKGAEGSVVLAKKERIKTPPPSFTYEAYKAGAE